jgi:hypothetical protein
MAENEPNIRIKTRLCAGRHLCGSIQSFAYCRVCYLAPANPGWRGRYANAHANTDRLANSHSNAKPCGHRQALRNGYELEHASAF